MGATFERLATTAVTIAAAVVVGAAAWLCFYASPSADDFCRASIPLSQFPAGVLSSYQLQTGRWVEQAIDIGLFPRHGFTTLYPVFLIALLAAYFAATYSFLSRTFAGEGGWGDRAQLSVGFLAVAVAGMPYIGEGLFWATGAVCSVLPVFGIIYVLGLLMDGSSRPTRTVHYAAAVIFPLLVTGLHEMFAMVLCILLGLGACATIWTRHDRRRLWVVALASAVAGSLVEFVAPGNFVRAARYFGGDLPVSRWEVLSHATQDWGDRVVHTWLLDPTLWAATFFFVCHPAVRRLRPDWTRLPATRPVRRRIHRRALKDRIVAARVATASRRGRHARPWRTRPAWRRYGSAAPTATTQQRKWSTTCTA